MARARLLKPSFFTNEDLGRLPIGARLVFQGLWTVADREGRLEDRPLRLKVEILPYDRLDINALLDRLHETGFIVRYEAEGNKWIQIVNFSKHQHVHPKEPASLIPAQDKTGNARTSPGEVRTDPSEALNPSSKAEALERKHRRSIDPPERTRASANQGGEPHGDSEPDPERPFANLGAHSGGDDEQPGGGA